MTGSHWTKEFGGSITVCDADGTILEMNDRADGTFQDQGGHRLIGSNLLDCHPPEARAKLEHLMQTQQANVYTIEKDGKRKLIYQGPWYEQGKYSGFVELALEMPPVVPHFVRGQRP